MNTPKARRGKAIFGGLLRAATPAVWPEDARLSRDWINFAKKDLPKPGQVGRRLLQRCGIYFTGARAEVAQLVEQGTENPRVGSSILSLGTTKKLSPYDAIRRGFLLL